jgi:hypothetical protein
MFGFHSFLASADICTDQIPANAKPVISKAKMPVADNRK